MLCAIFKVVVQELKSAVSYRMTDGKLILEFDLPPMNGRTRANFN